ncbi:MAG: lamin tail domain-containing protein [Bacteroidales bacterium]|nr:lamin tail domain-containing protein [Bacteroidales bacterium]
MKSKILFLFLAVLPAFFSKYALAQFDTLRVMYYNTLNYPDAGDPNRDDYFRTINQYLKADVILINELTSEVGAFTLLNDALNVYGTTHYQKANFTDGPDTDNMLFYNGDKLVLHSQWYIPTALRHINEYVLYYRSDDLVTGGDTTFFYFYSAHLKAYPEEEFQLERLEEVNNFKERINSIAIAENIFFGGDLNLYNSDEPAYLALINDGIYPLDDPLVAGDWHNNTYYRFIHTQSTRTTDFGGGSTGGLDDRFDFILFSEDVLSGTNKVKYIENTCIAFGNDGNHFNDALIDLPLNPNIPDSVTYALYYMSDHLPVVADFRVEATQDTTTAKLVITEIMYNPPEGGTDSLEYIEVYNGGHTSANLGGYTLTGVDFTFPGSVLNPGEFIVLAVNADAMVNTFGISALQWTSGALSNGGEQIILKDPSGKTVDSVNYSTGFPWPTAANGLGPSLILCNPQDNNAQGSNWSVSNNLTGYNNDNEAIYATPGFTECDFPPIAIFSASPTEIYMGDTVSFTDLSVNSPTSWNWAFEGGTPSGSSLQNPVITYDTPGVFDVILSVSNGQGTNEYLIRDYIVVTQQEQGNLMITEIMQNPLAVGDADGEWFEIFNPANNPIDLSGWKIKDNGIDAHTINGSLIVPSKGFVVLGSNINTALNGNYTCNYQYTYINFQLANGDDEIILLMPDDTEVDRIEYDGGPNWPDPNGASMIFTGNPNDDNSNFTFWSTTSLREPSYSGGFSDKGSPGTNGTGQNLIVSTPPAFDLQIKVFLEGPYNGEDMNTQLIGIADFPFVQPFNTYPWYYYGDESVISLPNDDIVDWVLIELRDASDVASATSGTSIIKRACYILSDGSLVDMDGASLLHFELSVDYNLFVVVYHRNHLGVISNYPLTKTGDIYSYNFTTGINQAYQGGLAHKDLGGGVFGMVGGDGNNSRTINDEDKISVWQLLVGFRGYIQADYDLDGEIDNQDKNDIWLNNQNQSQQIPE